MGRPTTASADATLLEDPVDPQVYQDQLQSTDLVQWDGFLVSIRKIHIYSLKYVPTPPQKKEKKEMQEANKGLYEKEFQGRHHRSVVSES